MDSLNTQEVEISTTELTTEELETVTGSHNLSVYSTVMLAAARSFIEAGGSITILWGT